MAIVAESSAYLQTPSILGEQGRGVRHYLAQSRHRRCLEKIIAWGMTVLEDPSRCRYLRGWH